MVDLFYRSFEERFYAPRSVIKNLRKQYLGFCKPLADLYYGAPCFDIGCGRGEWLELLLELGFSAHGVDLDEGMLQACKELNLSASKGDAIEHLARLPNESQAIVTAFHVVEHISFNQLVTLVSNALRVLKPGGLLIMETPNPENIVVATRNFYLDPTHQRPIPPLLLEFLPEYHGFSRTKTIRLQQNPHLETAESPNLNDVIEGASPDYAVIGQKKAEPKVLKLFDEEFLVDRGLTTHSLAARYDKSRGEVIKGTVAIAQRALSSADAASTAAQQALSSADAASGVAQQAFADSRLTRELIANVEAALQHYQHLTAITEQRVNDLLNSTSWRVTAPLRWLSTALRKLLGVPWRVFRFGVRALMLPVMRFVLARPSLRQALRSALKRFPSVAHRLHLLAIHRGLVPAPATPSPVPPTPAAEPGPPLTPPAKRIYDELKKAIEQRNKETQNP